MYNSGTGIRFIPAKSKAEAVARLYANAQVPAEPLGPGSKEKKSVLTKSAEHLELSVDKHAPKDHLAREILEALGKEWDRSYSSTGQTVTLKGLNAILEAMESELHKRAVREMRSLAPMLPDWFAPARDKLEAVRRISSITGGRPQDLGKGSKERKSVFIDLVENLGLQIDITLKKDELAGAIAKQLNMPWTATCWSTGQTVTLEGLNAVLAGAESRVFRGPHSAYDKLKQEAQLIVKALGVACPGYWDGYDCVTSMLDSEYKMAKQTEWAGWYFEFIGIPALVNAYKGGREKIGSTEFDYVRNFVWDLKTHAQEGLRLPGQVNGEALLNDYESIMRCVRERGSIGFVVLSGRPSFDGCAEFDAWHRKMRASTGVKSKRTRRLKVSLTPVTIQAYTFLGENETERAISVGALKLFKQGRQPSGEPRRSKLKLSLSKAQEEGLVAAQYDFLR